MTTFFLFNLLAVILAGLMLPLAMLILYLRKYLKLKNGNASKFRRVIFRVAVAKFAFLGAELVTVLIVGYTGQPFTRPILTCLIVTASILFFANWYGFFKTREILKDELDGLIL
jgi:hypothetical protein